MTDLGPQVAISTDQSRLHLQHGPIDLIIEADGSQTARVEAFRAATERFHGLLGALVEELPILRTPLTSLGLPPIGDPVAARMIHAVRPFGHDNTITPMAAVAGAVADEVGGALGSVSGLARWLVNNGGDIALWLSNGQRYRAGLVADPRRATIESTVTVDSGSGIGGIATSGRHGRSFSLGIADAVTVFAPTAALADAAATVIANHVAIGNHPEIRRLPACELEPESDLGSQMVVADVGTLAISEIQAAVTNGLSYAEDCVASGLIVGAVLHLGGIRTATGLVPDAAAKPPPNRVCRLDEVR